MTQHLISIILPTYNGKSEWLSEAIDSVLGQTYKNWELIIINDASTNDIEKTILQFVEKDQRIKYIKNEQNIKQAASRNKWIKQAQGKYIAFIDDDDIWSDSQKLEKQVTFLENNPDHGLCGTSTITVDQNKKEFYRTKIRVSDKEIRNTILQSNQFANSSCIIRKDVFNNTEGYNADFSPAEDYDLWCKLWRISKFYNLPDYCLTYRIHLNSSSNLFRKRQQRLAFKVCWINRKYYPNFWKALILRSWEYILPSKLTQKILSWIKKD